MSEFKSNYARVVVRHNDPRGLESALTNRFFRIEILHRLDAKDPESAVDEIVIEGSIGDVIHLLKTLRVNRVEASSRRLSVGTLIMDSVPFKVRDALEHLKTDPKPLTCFVTDITMDEILERLQLWEKGRDEEQS